MTGREGDPTQGQREIDRQHAEFMHRLEAQNELGQAALKSMMLVNGGAIVGLLTFVGNKGTVANACALKMAMGMFGVGLFLGLLAYFGAYFSQAQFMFVLGHRIECEKSEMAGVEQKEVPSVYAQRGLWCLWLAIISLFGSLLCFGAGALAALNGIL